MEALLNRIDLLRSTFLKTTLRVSLFRQVYTTRAYRLFFFFLVSILFNSFLALQWPLWLLLLGPLILGVPHLVSSMRYLPKLTALDQSFSYKTLYSSIGGFFILIATLRLLMGTYSAGLLESGPNFMELSACFLVLSLVGFFSSISKLRLIGGAGVLLSLFIFSWRHPLETLGFLVLAHNFIAFFFWIGRASDKKDKVIAILCLSIFTVLSGALLLGAFDVWIGTRAFEILNGSFNEMSLGAQIFPQADAQMWSRAVSAYALGQGIHYFIWLKAIPEQELTYQHTPSFEASFKLLRSDLGVKIIYAAGWITLALVGYGLLMSLEQARVVYLSLAAVHGYLEITSLALIQAKPT